MPLNPANLRPWIGDARCDTRYANCSHDSSTKFMSLEQLMGRYFRLTQELAIARKAQPWQTGLMAQLAKELTLVEREIAAFRPPRQLLPDAMRHAA